SHKVVQGVGLDYTENMVQISRQRAAESPGLRGTLEFQHGSVLELPFETDSFDVITSARCLMALLDWELQQAALRELHRVLRPGGTLVLMEGTLQGLDRLNAARKAFGLSEIAAVDQKRLLTLKFDEQQLIGFASQLFHLRTIHRFGMYYFITRVL